MQRSTRSRSLARFVPAALITACAAFGSGAAAEEPAAGEAERQRAAALVGQLGDSSYAVRRAATRELLALGLPAIPALQRAADDDDLEVRYRATRLFVEIRLRVHSQRLDRFLADPESVPAELLPGLKRYRDVVGNDAEARRLFVEMQRAEPELFVLIEADGRRFEESLNARSLQIRFLLNLPEARKTLPATAAALMFLATTPNVTVNQQAAASIYTLANYTEFQAAMTAAPAPSPTRRLVGHWIKNEDSAPAQHRMLLALRYSLEEGLTPALSTLERPGNAYELQYALLAVGRFGKRGDLPAVEKLFDNRTLLTQIAGGKNNAPQFSSQVRDVALAVAAHLAGQDAQKEYGFARLSRNPQYLYNPNTAGFPNDAARDAAFKKWADHKAQAEPDKPAGK